MLKSGLRITALALAISLFSSIAPAAQIRYTVSGVGSGYLDQATGPDIPITNLATLFTAVGDTGNYFYDSSVGANLIPIYDVTATFTGPFGTVSPPLASPSPGAQRIFAVGLSGGPYAGKAAFGEVQGSLVDVGDGLSGPGLVGWDGLSALDTIPVTLSEADIDLANGNTVFFNSFSSLNFSATLLGLTPSDPLLPEPGVGGGGFSFNFDATGGVPVYVDPPVAVGYDFVLGAGSPLITQAIFPVIGSSSYDVFALSDLSNPLFSGVAGGSTVDFTSLSGYASGIFGFALRGIDPLAGLDPDDPTAFVTGLVFAEDGPVSLTQIPVTAAVPEPATWAMMIAGFGLVGGVMRRRGSTGRLIAA